MVSDIGSLPITVAECLGHCLTVESIFNGFTDFLICIWRIRMGCIRHKAIDRYQAGNRF